MPNLTIKDIARISGCSVSTISRVINDRPDVRPETKEHVLKVMREAGFVPNTNARQLKIQQSRSLVFVVKGTRNLFFSDFLVQLQRAATLYGYNGIVSYLDENANEIDAAEKILREIKPKGMIFLGGSVANFKKGFANITVPSVLTTLVSDELDFPNLSMVGVDDRAAAYTAVDYLIQQGHRKIAVLGGPVTSYPSVMRREGAQQAMQDAGILFSDKLYGLSNYDFESAYHAVNSLLARRADFTALFAMSDVIALGAIRALVSAGLRVPEDVSVIGFDGISSGVHSCDVTALEDTEVCVINYDKFEEAATSMRSMGAHVLKMLSREIVRQHGVMLLLGSMHAEERLAAFLLSLSQRFEQRGYSRSEFVLRMTRAEIGSYLGLKLETVSRVLSRFSHDGLIEVNQKHVRIFDAEGLRAIVSGVPLSEQR